MLARAIDSNLTGALGIALFSVVFWGGISFLISALTGWSTLAKRFRKQSEPLGETRTAGPFFYTVYMRAWSHYGSVITLTVSSDALFVSIFPLFRVGHPPLQIPWDQIQIGRARRFFINYVQLTLGTREKVPMRISQRMARNLGILDRVPV